MFLGLPFRASTHPSNRNVGPTFPLYDLQVSRRRRSRTLVYGLTPAVANIAAVSSSLCAQPHSTTSTSSGA